MPEAINPNSMPERRTCEEAFATLNPNNKIKTYSM